MKKVIIVLTAIVLVATVAIGVTHYYSVKILSASRAYTNFESQYSKGEKDAGRHLINYIYSHDEIDFLYFKNDISIPRGDSIARKALEKGKDPKIARIGFLMGNNSPSDLPLLIWFYKQFKDLVFFKSAIQSWQQADSMVAKLNSIGLIAYNNISQGKPVDQQGLILEINTISDNLTIKQQQFSATIGTTSRLVDRYVFIADIIISIIILGSSALLACIMLKKLYTSNKVIVRQNISLRDMNERINKFVHAVTHDLRSPLSSLTGLINVLERETDINNITEYTSLMRESILMQDKYIQEVLYNIQDENGKNVTVCNLGEVLNDVISQNNFFTEGKKVRFLNELEVWELKCNVADLKVIINNLISNAIKYADFSKPEQWIKVRSYRKEENCVIEIEDNGLGIKPEQRSNIFDKYFKSGTNKKSMGLGLYFTRQTIKEMNGTITVKSLFGSGTSFIVSLPL